MHGHTYSVTGVTIRIPPLRDRREDIPLLADHFARKHGRPGETPAISAGARDLLIAYDWPGNVRELENVVARALALNPAAVVLPEDLPDSLRGAPAALTPVPDLSLVDRPTLAEMERRYALLILAEAGGNKTKAAETLGIDRKTLYRLIGERD